MNQKEFAAALKQIDTGSWKIHVNESSDGAMRRGCYLENGIWKVYETDAKRRMKILYKSRSEEQAFDWLYQLLTESAAKKKWYEFWKR
ncbi:MAG: hypothetical protein IKZ26_05180 [Peptococcaceae bacterium]|nr:hypothetical protein [Peptococcaceae bacterium]